MKKLIAITALMVLFSLPSKVSAMDYMVGAKAGYYSWKPFYEEIGVPGFSDIGWGSGVLAGPILSVIMTPEISLSISGLAGKQSASWQSMFQKYEWDSSTGTRSGNYAFDVLRGDFDFAVSYRVAAKLRLLAGYKYLHMLVKLEDTTVEISDASPDEFWPHIGSQEFLNYFHGPAIGFGFSHAFSQHYFTTITASGVYMWGAFKSKKQVTYTPDPDGIEDGLIKRTDKFSAANMRQIGINIEPSIGMNPGNGLPIIMLGVRYQRFWVEFSEEKDELPEPGKWFSDTLIGIFVSAVLVF